MTAPLNDDEFAQFQRFMLEATGIALSSGKKALVAGRLAKHIQQRQLRSYGEYFRVLSSGTAPAEVQTAIDLLTTNETYFFREPKHFELLREFAKLHASRKSTFRAWSAASSSGEEAYSIAMVLADVLGDSAWEVVGSDISARMLARAQFGHYPMDRAKQIPPEYLKRFCLRGNGPQAGTLLIQRSLRERVHFASINLNERLPNLGLFDVIFLRNVMIYFNERTQRAVVARVLPALRPGGHFIIGHSESLHGIHGAIEVVAPSIYRQPLRAHASQRA